MFDPLNTPGAALHLTLEAVVDVSRDVIVEKTTFQFYGLSLILYAVWFYKAWRVLTVFSEL